jgi:glutamate synthase domain-containing protein 3
MPRTLEPGLLEWDLSQASVRDLNHSLHHELSQSDIRQIRILNPEGQHNLAVGVDAPVQIDILGHAGYFIGGMNKQAELIVHGNVGWSVAENMMSGSLRVHGCASECAGASMHGGLLVIEGDASARCGISLKGGDIVVGGSVGHASAFMAQAGTLVVCGDAGAALGDSLYEAVIYVRGRIHSLGADAQVEPLQAADVAKLAALLARSGFDHPPQEFQRVGSARTLYHWHVDAHQQY